MGPASILFSVFEVCCFFSGKNCVYLSSASFLSVITPLLHLCQMSLSREAMGYYWHSPLTRGTHTQTRMHTHMHAHTHDHIAVDKCRGIYAGRKMGYFLIDTDSIIQFHTDLRKHTHTHTQIEHIWQSQSRSRLDIESASFYDVSD